MKLIYGRGLYNNKIKNIRKQKSFTVWIDMIKRCYDEKYTVINTTYQTVDVCEDWLKYENYNLDYMKRWQLDKDIICKECKIYSPDTCAFVPSQINYLFLNMKKEQTGIYLQPNGKYKVQIKINNKNKNLKTHNSLEEALLIYKKAKEENVKRVANNFYGLIDIRIYNTLINYQR